MRSYWSGVINVGLLNVPISVANGAEADEADIPLREVCDCHLAPFDRGHRCSVAMREFEQALTTFDREDTDEAWAEFMRTARNLPNARRQPQESSLPGPKMVKAVERGETFVQVPDDMYDAMKKATDGKVINVEAVVPYDEAPLERTTGFVYVQHQRKTAGSTEALALLAAALEDRVMIGRWAGRAASERPVAIYRIGDVVVMSPLLHEAEMKMIDEDVIAHNAIEVPETRVTMLRTLLDSLVPEGDLDLSQFGDRSIDAKLAALNKLLDGETLRALPDPVKEFKQAPDLDALLAESLELLAA